jgi:hypothetical protein
MAAVKCIPGYSGLRCRRCGTLILDTYAHCPPRHAGAFCGRCCPVCAPLPHRGPLKPPIAVVSRGEVDGVEVVKRVIGVSREDV